MVTQINTLRVSAELDASKYTSGAQQKQAADRGMSQSGKEAADGIKAVGDAATQTDTKISQAGNGIERLKRQFVTGYAASLDFERSLKTIGTGLDKGKISAEQASVAVENLTRKYGQVANAADIAERGQMELSRAVAAANANMATQAATAEQAALAQRRMVTAANQNGPGGDEAANFRRQNLGFQLQDIGVSLYGGMPLTTVLAQQGTQIAGIYAGNGGVNAALKDFGAMIAMAARYLGPFAAAAAVAYGAVKLLQSYSVEATLAVDEATKALAAQAAPLGTLQGQIGELTSLQETYSKAIADTGRQSSAATSMIIANTEREFNARKSLLELEVKRQQALIEMKRSEIAIAGLGLRQELSGGELQTFMGIPYGVSGSTVNTRLDLERRGFADSRIGSVPFVRVPDEITGLDKTRDILDSSPLNDKIKELRANLELTEIGAKQLEDALKKTFDVTPYGEGDLPIIGPIPGKRPLRELEGDENKEARRSIDQFEKAVDKFELQAANFKADIEFERQQMDRSPIDQMIAARQRSSGQVVDLNSREAEQLREMDRIQELREQGKGFVNDLINGLRNGEKVGEAFGNAFLNGLSRAADKQIDRLMDRLLSWLFPASGGASASALPAMSTGVANTTLGAFLGAANDNAPGNMGTYRSAISAIESGGRYDALGPVTRNGDRAYGKYQMMGNNIGPWSQAALGRSISSDEFLRSPGLQDQIFDHRFGGYVNKYGASGAAQAWFGGPGSVGRGGAAADMLGTTGNDYVAKFNANVSKMGDVAGQTTQGLGGLNNGLAAITQNFGAGAGLGGGSSWLSLITGAGFGGSGQLLRSGGIGLFADGTDSAPGGLAMVGERGRELVNLPRGSQVIPNHRTENIMSRAANSNSGGGQSPKVDLHVHVNGGSGDAHIRALAQEGAQKALGDYQISQARGGISELNRSYSSRKN